MGRAVTSDWLLEDRGTWNGYQRFIDGVNIYPILPGKPLLVHAKTDRIPYMAQWSQQLFVVFFAAVPLALHKAWATLTAFILYMVVYALTVIHEVWGYSGIRVHGIVPSPIAWLLRVFNAELALEDHDLHHRRRWKKSFNYGKQTRDVGSTVWHVCREGGSEGGELLTMGLWCGCLIFFFFFDKFEVVLLRRLVPRLLSPIL